MKKLRLKLTTSEKINLLKYGHLEIERGGFPITIYVNDHDPSKYEMDIYNPYDIDKLQEELLSFAIHLDENEK